MQRVCYKRWDAPPNARLAWRSRSGASRSHEGRFSKEMTRGDTSQCWSNRLSSASVLAHDTTRRPLWGAAQLFINGAGIYKAGQLVEAPRLSHKTEGGKCNSRPSFLLIFITDLGERFHCRCPADAPPSLPQRPSTFSAAHTFKSPRVIPVIWWAELWSVILRE